MKSVINLINTMQFKQALEEAEKKIYMTAYRHTNCNQSKTARLLGVSRGTLISKIKKWGA